MANTNFNRLIYNDRITSVYDVTYNKNFKIHKLLFTTAVDNYVKYFCQKHDITKDEFEKTFNIIEKQINSIDAPSSIIQRNKTSNKRFELQYIVDLAPFWPNYKYKNVSNTAVTINPAENFGQDEVVYIDYVRNEATVYNNYLDEYKQIPLSNINISTKLSDNLKLK